MANSPWYGKEVLHYNFDGNESLGKKNLMSSDIPTGCSGITRTTVTQDGETFQRYTCKGTYTSNSWPNIQFPQYTITPGKKYQVSMKLRANKWVYTKSSDGTTSYGITLRHARVQNDYMGCVSVAMIKNASQVNSGWIEYSCIQQMDSTFTSGGTTKDTSKPHIEIYFNNTNGYVLDVEFDIKDVMVVETDAEIPYVKAGEEASKIYDVSGKFVDGTAVNLSMASQDKLGGTVASFSGSSYISRSSVMNQFASSKPFTFSTWFNSSNISATQTLICDRASVGGCHSIFIISSHFRVDHTGVQHTISGVTLESNKWYHFVESFDGTTMTIYLNGSKVDSYSATFTSFGNTTSFGGSQTNGGGYANYLVGYMADIQIFNVALSAGSVSHLYHSRLRLLKDGSIYSYKIKETGASTNKRNIFSKNMESSVNKCAEDSSLTKNKIFTDSNLKTNTLNADDAELLDSAISGNLTAPRLGLKDGCTRDICSISQHKAIYDENVYIEPDGSQWVRVFHHNNPAGARFSTSSKTALASGQVKESDDRWYCFGSAAATIKGTWEILVKQKVTSTSTETKYRWTQDVNPTTCTYAQLSSSGNVVLNKSSGYSTYSNGGFFLKNDSSTYLAYDNNTSGGNWYGAVGCFNTFNGGIPGMGTAVTTGYLDVYLRKDCDAVSTSADAASYINSAVRTILGGK